MVVQVRELLMSRVINGKSNSKQGNKGVWRVFLCKYVSPRSNTLFLWQYIVTLVIDRREKTLKTICNSLVVQFREFLMSRVIKGKSNSKQSNKEVWRVDFNVIEMFEDIHNSWRNTCPKFKRISETIQPRVVHLQFQDVSPRGFSRHH